MHYRITHRTTYQHSETVPLCQNALWLTPRNDEWQERLSHQLEITPTPTNRSTRTDYFGNEVTYFTLDNGYRSLDIVSVSEVKIVQRSDEARRAESPPWETLAGDHCDDLSSAGIDTFQYRFDSPSAIASDELGVYARESFTPKRAVLDAARELTSRIHADFAYDPRATTVQTSVAEAFGLRRGVCQDFAHVEIACLRSLGLPARYVSGYLRTIPPPNQRRLVGADASHAWISVYCGAIGWIDFDPTNDLVPSTDHVTIAWGRDYNDVTPVRGLFVGGGHHELSVSVDVAPMDENGNEVDA
jgi:transglutaminase-like putative cysteine protease